MRILALIFLFWPLAALADQIGEIQPIAHGWAQADGSCVADSDYPKLAAVLHQGKKWPHGRCDAKRFRLPNLTNARARFLIRVE
jgi:hypothetical protein